MTHMPGRFVGACLAVGVMLSLTGCVGLPQVSPVSSGQAINTGADREAIAIEPNGPGVGDDPRQIVAGFMQSQISSESNYAIAHEFLTTSAASAWHPGVTSTVFGSESQLTMTRPDVNTIALSVPVVGELSAEGRLQRKPVGTTSSLSFTLSHTASGWRISSLPKNMGVWISEDDFLRTYTSAPVYYPARVGTALVPDMRWFPKIGLTTALARATLSQPSPWLANAVSLPFPSGTDLQVDSVPVSDAGVADISLTQEAAGASALQKSAIWATMAATLGADSSVSAINISVRGRRLETDNLPATVREPRDVGFSLPPSGVSSVIARSGLYSAWSTATSSQASTGSKNNSLPKLPAISSDWIELAAGQGGRQIAGISADRRSLRRWVSGAPLGITVMGQNLGRPDFDAQGWLWVAGQTASASASSGNTSAHAGTSKSSPSKQVALWVMDTSKTSGYTPAPLRIPWLNHEVISMSLSPEGDRIALVLAVGKQTQVVVAAVIRNTVGAPVSLGQPLALPIAVSEAKSVVWADANQLAVLGKFAGVTQPVLVSLDGGTTALGSVSGADDLASTWSGEDGLFVHSVSGSVHNRLGSAWNSFLSHGEVIVPTS